MAARRIFTFLAETSDSDKDLLNDETVPAMVLERFAGTAIGMTLVENS